MATADDGVTSYQSGGAGGKFRKRPIRRNSQATPYDRPPVALRNNKPSLFAKLVDPASRLICAGADRLFSGFRKRLPPIPAERLPVTSEEPRNGFQEAGPTSVSDNDIVVLEPNTDGEMASIPVETEISELENMLNQKTFTRSEIERLTTLLHSRTTELDTEGDSAKHPITTSQVLRLEASTSGILNEHVKERETVNFHVPISTPITSSRAFEDDVATPAELAKAYMGTKSAKLSPLALRPSSQPPRQDPLLLNNKTILPKTPVTSLTPKPAASFKTFENCLTTPRSQGRSALYKNAFSPYYRGPSTLSQKGVASPSAWEHEGSIGSSRMGTKRRSSVIDDIVFGGRMRSIRQKVNLPSQQSSLSKHKSEFGSSQKLLLSNEPEPKSLTPVEENVETSKCTLGYGSVPTESSKMASKIFEQLNRMSPKEKPSGSKLAGITEKIDSPIFLSSSRDNKKSEGQHHVWLPDARESISRANNVLSSMYGNCTEQVRGKTPIVTNTSPTSMVPANPSSSNNTWSSVISQSTSLQKEQSVSQTFGTNLDAKPLGSMSFINSALNNGQVKFSASNKDDSGNTKKPVNLFGKSESSSSASPTTASASGYFSFGGSSTTNGSPASSPSIFASMSSYQSSGSNTNKLFSGTSSHAFSFATTAILPSTTTSAAGSAFSSSVAASVAPTKPFASTFATSSTGGSIFAFSSPSATLTANGFQANTQATSTVVTQAVPFKFESGTGGAPSTASGSFLISSSAPSFGLSSTVASTESKSVSSASGSTASIFGSTALQPPQFSPFGSTPISFGASSTTSSPLKVVSSVAGASTGSSVFSFSSNSSFPAPVFGTPPTNNNNNGDHMSRVESMADDSTTQTPRPSGKPGFMFGSGTPSTVPFQYGGQTKQPQTQTPSQNPFQASAGSFSLGSGGGVKSDRRILKVKRQNKK